MEYPNPKIKFYKVRTMSQKLTVTFDFLRENWKPLLIFSLYLILPICLLQAFTMNSYIRFAFSMGYESASGAGNEFVFSFLRNFIMLFVFIILGSSVLYAMVYSLMTQYESRESRLMKIKWEDIMSSFIRNVGKLLRVNLFLIGISLLISALIVVFAILSTWVLIILIPVAIIGVVAVMVPFTLFMPIYLFEEIPFFAALRKSFRYGFSFWGETLVIIVVFSLLANIVSGVTTIPWYFVIMFGEIFSLVESGAGFNNTIWYQFISYLLGILQSYGVYISYIFSTIGIAFHYFHIREKKEGISVDASIQNFERL